MWSYVRKCFKKSSPPNPKEKPNAETENKGEQTQQSKIQPGNEALITSPPSTKSPDGQKPQTDPNTPSDLQTGNETPITSPPSPPSPDGQKPQTDPNTPSDLQTGKEELITSPPSPPSPDGQKPQTDPNTPSDRQTGNEPPITSPPPPKSPDGPKPQTDPNTPSDLQTGNETPITSPPSPPSPDGQKPQTDPNTPSESQTGNETPITSPPSPPSPDGQKPQTDPNTPSDLQTGNETPITSPPSPPSPDGQKPQTDPNTPSDLQTGNEMPITSPPSPPSPDGQKPQTDPNTPSDLQTGNEMPITSPPSPPSPDGQKPQTEPNTPSDLQTGNEMPITSPPSPPSPDGQKPQTEPNTPSDLQTGNETPITSPPSPPSPDGQKPQTDPNTPSDLQTGKCQVDITPLSETPQKGNSEKDETTTQDQEKKAKRGSGLRAVIFSVEKDDDMKSLENWTRNIIPDCELINPTAIEDWKSVVEDSAIVIVYTTSSSYERFMGKMGEYMDHWKGYEKVIVVIGDIQTSENEVRSEWDGGLCPQWELHLFTKTERQWIRQDPQMQGMLRKIRKIKDIVLRDYQEDITLKGKKKIHVKLVSMSDNHKNKNKESKKQDQKRGSVNENLNQDPSQKEARWLETLLRDNEMLDFTFCHISEIKKPKEETSLTCILLFTKETFQKIITEKKNSDQQYIKNLKGQKNLTVVVVVHDLDDESSEKDLEDKYKKSEYKDLWPLFLFRREEQRPEYQDYISAEATAEEKWRKFKESIKTRATVHKSCDTADATRPPTDNEKDSRTPGNLGIVGIFSRSSITDYSWIEKELTSADVSPVVSGVRPFYISNNQTGKFYEELGLCSFGILYHTKNRGRVNVTNVTDSLYDEELAAMSLILRRENVIVVIDDLNNSSLEEKQRILETQPSIDDYAFDLLLYSEQEKKDGEHKERLRQAIISLAAGKKTEGTRNSRKNQPENKEKNTGNRDDQSNDEKTATMCSSP
ncbi:uncharacterized protein LOC143785055 isoform X2 [Ranitomeya variabilis]|uniref:uncharacterized protein LOC143785055 isoform X2 n=1 Tax=Ranitomeya variabilis TaxID=490064 RepID=UPI004057C836